MIESDVSNVIQKLPTKLERLKVIHEKDIKVKDILEAEPIRLQVLYRISKLSSDVIPSREKASIKECTREIWDEMETNGTLSTRDFYKKMFDRLSRKAIKKRLLAIKLMKFELCAKNDVDLSNVIPKL